MEKLNAKVTHTLTHVQAPLRGSHIHPPSRSWRRKGRNYGRRGRSLPLTHRSETRAFTPFLRRVEKRINPLRSRAKKKRAEGADSPAKGLDRVGSRDPGRTAAKRRRRGRALQEERRLQCSEEGAGGSSELQSESSPSPDEVGRGEWEGDLPSARPASLQHHEFLQKQHKPAVLAAPEPLLRGCSPARLPEPRSRGRGPFVLLPLSSRAPTFLRRQRPEQPPLLCGGWDTAPEKS